MQALSQDKFARPSMLVLMVHIASHKKWHDVARLPPSRCGTTAAIKNPFQICGHEQPLVAEP